MMIARYFYIADLKQSYCQHMEGRSGVLRMENYTEDSKFISFEQDEQA